MWDTHTAEYYSVIKMNAVVKCATTWMNQKHMMVNKRSQLQKNTHGMIPNICYVQNRQIHRDKKQIRGCQWLEGGGNGSDFSWGQGLLER